jgi:hypothetical protein
MLGQDFQQTCDASRGVTRILLVNSRYLNTNLARCQSMDLPHGRVLQGDRVIG